MIMRMSLGDPSDLCEVPHFVRDDLAFGLSVGIGHVAVNDFNFCNFCNVVTLLKCPA